MGAGTPWSRASIEALAAKALDRTNPSSKPRQAVFDYAVWHGQHEWLDQLGRAGFAPARALMNEYGFVGAGTLLPLRPGFEGPWQARQQLVRKTVAALH